MEEFTSDSDSAKKKKRRSTQKINKRQTDPRERVVRWLGSHWFGSVLFLLFLGVLVAAQFTDAIEKIDRFRTNYFHFNAQSNRGPNPGSSAKTLGQLFKENFPSLLKSSASVSMVKDGATNTFVAQTYLDFSANSEFIGFYIPRTEDIIRICLFLSNHPDVALNLDKRTRIESRFPGERAVESTNLVFTKKVFIYHDSTLFASDEEKLIAVFRDHSLDVQFRGPDYLWRRTHLH